MPQSKRILIVGAGSIGLKHIRAFSSADPSVQLAVVDPDPGARTRASELGAQVLDGGWDSLSLSGFDGVVIGAPAPLHVPYSIRCLREGIPVLSEKPLSHAWDGVEELSGLAGRDGTPPSGAAYVRRYIPVHEEVRELVNSGETGPVLALRISAGQPFTKYRPDYRDIYYASREQGGGCTLDFASHFIDLAQWYLGPIKSVRGYAEHLALEGVEVEDTVATSFESETGALGCLHVNQFQPVNENVIDLCGPESCLRIVEPSFTCRIWRRESEEWQDLQVGAGDYFEGLRRQAAAFLKGIDGGPPMRTSIAQAAHTLRLCLDLLESGTAGK